MNKVLETITEKKLIKKNETIGVAVSGGQDSMALLHYLASLQDELEFEVVAIHIDHSLRTTSAQDAFFVLNYCKKNRIRAYKFKVDVKKKMKDSNQSVETAARDARYGVFESLIKKKIVDKVALAHHMEDQA
ncbi:MAG: tRNA lysidine(34) synthetase TilS, partial [Clostridia bacterium]|nr:tRNA lysidine(34) synthetase TilS [Clostridia bacterium]